MLAADHLTLSRVCLKQADEWLSDPQRLSFIFPKNGTGKHLAGAMTQRLAPGDVLVANSAPGSKVCVDDSAETSFSTFSVSLENLISLCASREICLLQNVVDDLCKSKFYPAASPAAVECHQLLAEVSTAHDLRHRCQLLRIASVIVAVELKGARREHTGFVGVQEHLIHVFESLSSAEILKLSVDELAAKFSCSRRHLSRLFHQYFGFPLAALKMEMRLLQAVSLLRNPDLKIIRVAEECGFNHLGLFNTCFKRRFGDTPGRWRKKRVSPSLPGADDSATDGLRLLEPNGLRPGSAQGEVRAPAPGGTLPKVNPLPQAPSAGARRPAQNAEPRLSLSAQENRPGSPLSIKVRMSA